MRILLRQKHFGGQGAGEDVGGGCRFAVFCAHRLCVCLLVVGEIAVAKSCGAGEDRVLAVQGVWKLRRYYYYTVTNYSIAHVSSAGGVSGCGIGICDVIGQK